MERSQFNTAVVLLVLGIFPLGDNNGGTKLIAEIWECGDIVGNSQTSK